MAGFTSLSMGAKAALLVSGAAFVGLAAYGGWSFNHTAPAVQPVAAVAPAPAATQPVKATPAAAAPASSQSAALPKPEPAPQTAPAAATPAPTVPTFDVVRVDPDGSTVVAGRADPGTKIVLRVDGAEISATTTDASGNFVALFVLQSSAAPRVLTLSSVSADQTEIVAAAEVALAPTRAPTVVAAATPTPPVVDASAGAASEPAPQIGAAPAPVAQTAVVETAPTALLVTKDGVRVLQGPDAAAAADASNLAINTISYTAAGDVQLSGRAGAGSAIRIYLDNAPIADISVGQDGQWAATMPPIAPGLYTLRADQLAADGKVTARFETPFKRETKEALVAAAQTPKPTVDVATADAAVPVTTAPAATAAPAASQLAPSAPAAPTAPVASAVPDDAASTVVAAAAPSAPVSITVQPGFTLWGIASQQFGDGVLYVQVYQANKDKIRDPNLIYPGQVFVIPTKSE